MAHIDIFQNSLNKDERLELKVEYIAPNQYGFEHGSESRLKIELGNEKICIFLNDLCIAELAEARDEIDRYLAQVEQIEKQKEVEAVEAV